MRALLEFINHANAGPDASCLFRHASGKAVALFRRAAKHVPAYRHFLERNGVNAEKIQDAASFAHVPLINKKNYIEQYSLAERCWNGTEEGAQAIAASSGSTGAPLFWPRYIQQDFDFALIHERILRDTFAVHTGRWTLFVNTFALGNWSAGMVFQHGALLMQLRGMPICLASPGYSVTETLPILRHFAPQFGQTIVLGHPPFLRMLMAAAVDDAYPVRDWNLRFVGAGEGVSESFRDLIHETVGATDPLRTFINIYGSAEFCLMGFETPLSIAYKRGLVRNTLRPTIVVDGRDSFVYQFDPSVKYLESVQGDIVTTADSTMPLVRYDILDEGEVLWPDAVSAQGEGWLESDLIQQGVNPALQQLPMVVIRGRRDVAVSLFAINIYPESLKRALEDSSLVVSVTGRLRVRKEHAEGGRDRLVLDVELRPNVEPSAQLSSHIAQVVVAMLRSMNSEYCRAYETLGSVLDPLVRLVAYEDPEIFPSGKLKKLS